MSDLSIKIEVEERRTYWQRMGRHILWFGVLMPLVISIFIYFAAHEPSLNIFIISSVFVIVFFTLLSFFAANRFIKGWITYFQIQDGKVYIEYTEKDQKRIINGNLEDFTFILRLTGQALVEGSNALQVKYKGETILTQPRAWEWNKPFPELIKFLKENHLLEVRTFLWFRIKT